MSDILINSKKITVLGAGVSGVALARLGARMGADVFLSDSAQISASAKKALNDSAIPFEEGGHTDRILEADEIIVGSGFPPSAHVLKTLRDAGAVITGELDFVFSVLDSYGGKRAKIICITGSNGKTTTTSLVGHLLRSTGADVSVVGNIGSPIADIAERTPDYIVCELSSFQLHWANDIHVDCAVVTNLAPDHIDWHGSYEAYVSAKAKIMSFVGPSGVKICQKRDVEMLGLLGSDNVYTLEWGSDPARRKIVLDDDARRAYIDERDLFCFDKTRLLGSHNMENIAMALAAAECVRGDDSRYAGAVSSFTAPPHRCALVCNIDGVNFVDDSKGTNIAATVTALSSLPGKKSIILGGRGKGEDYADLLPALREHAKWATLIGEETEKIALALDRGGYENFSRAGCMEVAVKIAASHAEEGDIVLLSPACTSWDMYNNYGERGDHFASIARKMADRSVG